MNRRQAILTGVQAAGRVHEELGTREELETTLGGVNVFGALLARHAALLFKPLTGILGCCIPGDVPGVLISTERPLAIQRFTGAHELGHVVMGHTQSLDGPEILTRGDLLQDPQEIAADSFASAFLLPRWLLQIHGRRQEWRRESLSQPHVVYQFALRVGASFHATVVALERYEMIDQGTRDSLLAKPRRELKAELLNGLEVEDYRRNVWLLTERDEGTRIEGGPEDIFILKLRESGSAGYVWDAQALYESGFAVLRDQRLLAQPKPGAATRQLTANHPDAGRGAMRLSQKRPFQPNAPAIAQFDVAFELFGKERGMPRANRPLLLAA